MSDTKDVSTQPDLTPPKADVFAVDPSIKARRRDTRIVNALRIALLVVTLTAWQLTSGRLISEFWISSPTAIWEALLQFLRDGVLGSAVRVTLVETAIGFALGAATGILIGIASGVNSLVARVLDPFLVAFNSIPRVALIPLFILWFGIGLPTKVLFAATLVFFPVFMNTFAGCRDVDRDLLDVLKVMGASRLDTIRRVLVPSALAWVFAGLRVSIPFALIGAVIAEMFTANDGLGYLISVSANQYDTAGSFAAIGVTTALGIVLTWLVAALERRVLRWQPSPA